jgi:hypothetical protein
MLKRIDDTPPQATQQMANLVPRKCGERGVNQPKKVPCPTGARRGLLEVSVYNQDPIGVRPEQGPSINFGFNLEQLS